MYPGGTLVLRREGVLITSTAVIVFSGHFFVNVNMLTQRARINIYNIQILIFRVNVDR